MKPKLLYIGMKYDYGSKQRGVSFEHRNFYHPLKSYCMINGWEFIHYDFMDRSLAVGVDLMTEELYEYVKREKPDYLFAVLFDFNRDPRHEVFKRISELGVKTIHWFCDDHWRFEKYSSVIAPNFDFVCTTANSAVPKYKEIGMSGRMIKSQWACNHELYVPYDIKKDIDISFVGQSHGDRKEVIERLIQSGVNIKVFGFNWEKYQRIPFHQMVRVFSRSRINLNLSNSSTMVGQQIKGRNFEIPGTNSFLLTSNAENLEEYYKDGEEIVIFNSTDELIDKTRYYLNHPKEIERIAANAYKRTLAEHTWHHRFKDIFNFIEKNSSSRGVQRPSEKKRKKQTSGEPLISVVIPCYNQADLLPDAVESVVNQTYKNWECIIVNDGSPDNTSEVASRLIEKHKDFNIKLIEKKNGGLAEARNSGIKAAAGKYILPLDSDDLIHPGMLEQSLKTLLENPDASIAYTDQEYFGKTKRIVRPPEFNPMKLLLANYFAYCSLYKKEVWRKTGGYKSNMKWGYEDWEFWITAVECGFTAKRVPEVLFRYRVREDSMLSSAQEHDAELKAKIILNHPKLYTKETAKWASNIIKSVDSKEKTASNIKNEDDNNSGRENFDEKLNITAIIAAYNEEDVIYHVIKDLVEQDINVYLIDHHSSDNTVAEASRWVGKGLIKIETFPEDSGLDLPDDVYSWRYMLRRKEIIAQELGPGWYIHADADEFRESPWRGLNLRQGIERVNSEGYNAIDFKIYDFKPTDNNFKPGSDVRDYLKYYSAPQIDCDSIQHKCWKNFGQEFTLWKSGGHIIEFEGKKVYPVPFILRHYPVRSQSHGLKKVFNERKNRFDKEEKKATWHAQYDHINSKEHNFIYSKSELKYFDREEVLAADFKNVSAPMISIVIPCFNQGEFLPDAVGSLAAQTYKNFECIIVNDGSTDDTREAAEKLIAKYGSLKLSLLNLKNGGLSNARNKGIEKASGKYILPLDADDTLKDTALSVFMEEVEKNPDYDIFYPDYETFGEIKKVVTCIDEEEYKNINRSENGLPYCSLYKREVWAKNSGYNKNMIWGFEDWNFWISSVSNDFKAKHISVPLFNYRIKKGSMITGALKNRDHLLAQTVLNHKAFYEKDTVKNALNFIAGNPVVSVLIPTYNRPALLKNAVGSVLNQTFGLFEIIVVNDAGPDVGKVLMEFSDPRIKYFQHGENKGLAAARNTGLKEAKGKYIAQLDDDDIFYPDHLRIAVKNLSSNEKVIYTDAVRCTFEDTGSKEISRSVPYSIDYSRDKILIGNLAPVNCFVFEKSLIEQAGSFDENLPVLEDWEFWLRLSSYTQFKHIKENTVQVNWYNDGSTMSSSKGETFIETRKLIHEKYREEIDSIENWEKIVDEFNGIWREDFVESAPDVSIIALSYNQFDYTELFVKSVIEYTDLPFELILIDNGSDEETVNALKKLSAVDERIRVVFNSENLGFPGGVNQGIKLASGKYIVIANNDIVVTENWLSRMIDAAESDEQIGLVGPVSNSVSGVQLDKEAAYNTIEGMHKYASEVKRKNSGQVFAFPRVAFLCTLIKKEVIERLGGLDERFSPGNFEDDDYCLRAQIAGYKTVVAKDVFIHHFGSKSFSAEGTKKYEERIGINKKIFVDKWGADPEEIWLKGKSITQRNIFIPLDNDEFAEKIKRANINAGDKEYTRALENIDKALKSVEGKEDPSITENLPAIYHLAGKISLMLSDTAGAEEFFGRELSLQPDSVRAAEALKSIKTKSEEELISSQKT